MTTIEELLKYCYQNNKDFVTTDEMKAFVEGCNSLSEESDNTDFPPSEDITSQVLDLLTEVAASHERKYTPLEKQIIETGVMSGRCYICWHENKYYPGATVDNLKAMGWDAFYEKYKSNWEEVKNFRKTIIKNKNK